MINELLSKIDFPQLFNVLAGIVAFFVAYLRFLPLIPRSANKILSDIKVYKKSNEAEIGNAEIIKESIEREIRRKYRKPTRIYNYGDFLLSLLSLIIISYFIYDRIVRSHFDATFFFLLLGAVFSITILRGSFNEPEEKKKDVEEKSEVIREPIFSFQIFSWWELILGIGLTALFTFWTYNTLFNTGKFEFSWWSIITVIFAFSGIGVLTGAFKRNKNKN